MYKAKTFNGTFDGNFNVNSTSADEKFNEWINDHPNIHIIAFKYKQAHYGDHSICILYKDNIDPSDIDTSKIEL